MQVTPPYNPSGSSRPPIPFTRATGSKNIVFIPGIEPGTLSDQSSSCERLLLQLARLKHLDMKQTNHVITTTPNEQTLCEEFGAILEGLCSCPEHILAPRSESESLQYRGQILRPLLAYVPLLQLGFYSSPSGRSNDFRFRPHFTFECRLNLPLP